MYTAQMFLESQNVFFRELDLVCFPNEINCVHFMRDLVHEIFSNLVGHLSRVPVCDVEFPSCF